MARLSDLNLGDSGPGGRDELAIARQRADKVGDQLTQMIDSGDYDWCWGRLVDMRKTIADTGRVTEGQADAIAHIRQGRQRHEDAREGWGRHERRTGRRYEGWEG